MEIPPLAHLCINVTDEKTCINFFLRLFAFGTPCIAYAYVSPFASKMGMPCALIIYHYQKETRVENGRAQAWAFIVKSMCNHLIAIIGFDYG